MSTLSRLLAQFSDDAAVSEKTAADATPPATAETSADPASRMLETVRKFSKSAAAAPAPASAAAIPALDKIAADLVAADDATSQSKMASLGVIFADTVMARFAQYEAEVGTKVAAASPDAIKQAYAQGRADLEKETAAAYAEGQETALKEIHKVASDMHLAGQQSAVNVLQALAQGA